MSEFVRSHGSIKDMEKAFGISYPTVKNRLNRIIKQLQLVEIESASREGERRARPARARRDHGGRGGGEASAMIPPTILDLRVARRAAPVRLWLPLFLLWPSLWLLGVLVLVGRARRRRRAVPESAGATTTTRSCSGARSLLLCETRGMVRFSSPKTAVDMTVVRRGVRR